MQKEKGATMLIFPLGMLFLIPSIYIALVVGGQPVREGTGTFDSMAGLVSFGVSYLSCWVILFISITVWGMYQERKQHLSRRY